MCSVGSVVPSGAGTQAQWVCVSLFLTAVFQSRATAVPRAPWVLGGVRLMPASAALSCLGPGSVWRSGLAWCILALYIVVLFIPYSLVGAARQGLAAGCFHPQSLLCLWLQPTLSRPLRALLTLSKTKAIHTRTRTHSGAAGRASVLCPRPPLLPPQAQMGPGRLVAWARGPASVGPGLPLIWQQ